MPKMDLTQHYRDDDGRLYRKGEGVDVPEALAKRIALPKRMAPGEPVREGGREAKGGSTPPSDERAPVGRLDKAEKADAKADAKAEKADAKASKKAAKKGSRS